MHTVIFLVVFSIIFEFSIVFANPKAAIYIDNGRGQTAIDRLMTKDEKQEMEMEILHLLGLPKRPRKIKRDTMNKSASRFLIDIYKKLMEEENEENDRAKRNSDLNLSGEEQQQIDQSDVIMTFESINHHIPSVRHERGKRLWFNVSEVPVAEDIMGAELRIFQNQSLSGKKPEAKLTVTVYQLIKSNSGEKELEYINAVNTTGGFTGWLTLNVTGCLNNWVAFPESNKGFYLSVHSPDRPGHEIRPEDAGLVTVKSLDETQPFMAAFLKSTNHTNVKVRTTREAKTRVKKSDFSAVFKNSAYKNMGVDSGRSCQIHTLYISFKDLKWHDWIIAPDGYAAYYCNGECSFPLNAHMNASNHAIVQTLVHLMQPLRYPKSCCAPTKLSPISVLYFLDDTNVILKKYKQMVVKSCGCR